MVRSKMKSIIVAAVAGASMFASGASLRAGNSTWLNTGSTDGNWSTTSNWVGGVVPGVPSGTTDLSIATFNTAVGTYGTTGSPVVIDSGRNISGITFDTGSVGAFFIGSTAGNPLLLSSGGMIQATNSINNNETINAPLVIEGANGTYTFANNSSTNNKIFTFGGTIGGGAAGNTVLNLAGTSTGTNMINGVIGNGSATSMGLTVNSGTWALAATDTYTGSTTVNGGLLRLDFSNTGTPTSNIVSSSSGLVMGGGTILIKSKGSGNNNSQTFSGTMLNVGSSTIQTSNNSGTSSVTLGTINRNVGTTVSFYGSGASQIGSYYTTTANTGTSILGGWAVYNDNGTLNWATSASNGSTSGLITAYPSASYVNDTWSSANNTKVTTAEAPNGATTNSLFFNNTGTNAVTLTGANVINTGGILVASSGTDSIGGTGTLTSGSGNELFVNQYNTTTALTISASLVNNGANATALTKSGSGALTLTGANTYTGATYINGGTLNANSAGALGGSGGGTVYVNAGGTLTQSAASLAGTSATGLVISGGGSATLNQANTYTGSTSVLSGSLSINTGESNVATASTGGSATPAGTTITMASVAGLTTGSFITGNSAIPAGDTITAINTSTKVITLATATTASIPANTSLTLAGALGSGSSNVMLGDTSGNANATITLTSNSANVGRNIVVQGGNSGTATLTENVGSFNYNPTFSGTITMGSSGTGHGLSVSAGGYQTLNLTGVIQDPTGLTGQAGILTVGGSSTVVISATNTYSGGTVVNSGILNMASTGSLGTGTLTINGGSLQGSIAGSGNGNNAQIWNNNINMQNGTGLNLGTGSVALTGSRAIGVSNGTTTVGGVIADSGGSNFSITFNGGQYGGTLYLNGANTFDGGMILTSNTGGPARFNIGNLGTSSAASAIGTGTFVIGVTSGDSIQIDNASGASGTLATNNAQTWNDDFTFAGSKSLNMGTGNVSLGTIAGATRTVTVNANTLTVGGISNGTNGTTPTVNLTKAGGGTLVLGGSSTYTGATAISAGVLQVNNTNALQDSTLAVPATASSLVFMNGNIGTTGAFTVGGLSGSNNLTLADSAHTAINLSIGGGNTSSSYGGVLSNYSGTQLGAVTKVGSGTVTLSGANTYGGGTSVSAGTLILTGINTTTGATTVSSGANLTIGNSQAIGTGALTLSGGAILDAGSFTGQRLTTNNVQNWNGSFTFVGSNSLNLGTGAVTLGASPTVNVSNTLTVGGSISGSYGLTKTGSGTLVLSGTASSYNGGTTVSSGTLTATSGAALGGSSAGTLTVSSGATFNYTAGTDAVLNVGGWAVSSPAAIGVSIGSEYGSSEILVGSAASGSGTNVPLSIALVPGSNPAPGTYTLVSDPSGGLLSGCTYSLVTTSLHGDTLTNLTVTDYAITVDMVASSLTTAYWKGGYSTAPGTWSATDGSANSNWTTDSAGTTGTGVLPSAATSVIFSAAGASNQGSMVLGGSMAIKGMTVNDSAPLLLSNDASNGTLSIDVGGITVNAGASVTLNAPLALTGAQTWTNNSSNALNIGGTLNTGVSNVLIAGTGDVNISGVMSGDGNITMSSTGTLSVTGNNAAFTGDTTVTAGTLAIGNASALGNGFLTISASAAPVTIDAKVGGMTIANDQQWNSSFTFTGTNSVTMSGAVTLGGDATVTVSNNTLTLNGVISGTHALTMAGSGTMVLNGANIYTGGTTISGGTLQINGSVMGGITDNAALVLGGSSQTVANTISGSGTVSVNSPGGSVTLSGSNTYTGNTSLVAGTLVIGNSKALSGGGTLVISAGTTLTSTIAGTIASPQTWNGNFSYNTSYNFPGTYTTFSGPVTLGNDVALALTGGNDYYLTGKITGSHALTLSGNGEYVLTGNSDFSGGVTLNSGNLCVGNNNALGTGTLTMNGGAILGTGAVTLPNAVILNITYLNCSIGNALPWSTTTNYAYAGGLTLGGPVTVTGNTTITIGGGGGWGITGAISDGGKNYGLIVDFSQYGPGPMTLGGASTNTGGVTLDAGGYSAQLNIGLMGTSAGSALGMGPLTINATAGTYTLDITGTDNGGILGTNNALVLKNDVSIIGHPINFGTGAVTLVGGNRTVTIGNTSTTIGGVISGAYGLSKAGTGKLVLAGSSVYTGGTTIQAGTLQLGVTNALPVGTTVTLGTATTNGTLDLGGQSQTVAGLAIGTGATAGSQVIGNSSTTGMGTLVFNGGTSSFGGVIQDVLGTGTQTTALKVSGGNLTLTGVNTYTGGTTVSGGTLTVSADSALGGAAGGLTLTGGTLQFGTSAFDPTATRSVTLGTGGGTINTNGNSVIFTGTLLGTGGLTKAGVGQLTVQNLIQNAAVGVTGGKLLLSAGRSDNTLETLSGLSFANGGVLDLSNHDMLVTNGLANGATAQSYHSSITTNAVLTGSQNDTGTIALVSGKDYKAVTGTGSLSDTDLYGKFTYLGDANLDGKISADDYLALDVGYLFGLTGWTHGDFEQTGFAPTAQDYADIDFSYQTQAGVTTAAGEIKLHTQWFGAAYTSAFNALSSAAVPEPTSLGLLAVGALALLRRKGRK